MATQMPQYTSILTRSENSQPSKQSENLTTLPQITPSPIVVGKIAHTHSSSQPSQRSSKSYLSMEHEGEATNVLPVEQRVTLPIQPSKRSNSTFWILGDMASTPFMTCILQHSTPKHFSMPKFESMTGW